jgi:KDO2-lipid IV(A) lauroyltransferase
MSFFGRKAMIPKGPASLSRRLGSAIVPCFMIREPDDTFRLIMDPPILPDLHEDEETSIKKLTEKCTSVIESYVRRYPTQWYIFREMWNGA